MMCVKGVETEHVAKLALPDFRNEAIGVPIRPSTGTREEAHYVGFESGSG